MAADSDELLKRELCDKVGEQITSEAGDDIKIRIFTDGSTEDQLPWEDGGLTFKSEGLYYGSNDAAYFIVDGDIEKPIMALELTDALNRGGSGNAQYQRFYHALGAVRSGVIGVYYLKEGVYKVQPDLYKMALSAWDIHETPYIISQDLDEIKTLLELWSPHPSSQYQAHLNSIKQNMQVIFDEAFEEKYNSDWEVFAEKRSTIIFDSYIIKYGGAWFRNFSGSHEGHVILGEMYLSLYLFPLKKLYYLWPKMTGDQIKKLDEVKKTKDKEWLLLRNDSRAKIITRDDIHGLDSKILRDLELITDKPLVGESLKTWNRCRKYIHNGLGDGSLSISASNSGLKLIIILCIIFSFSFSYTLL